MSSDLQFVNVEAFDDSKHGIDKLVDLAEAQKRRQEQDRSKFRDSHSSLLALSEHHGKRLQEIWSVQSSPSEKMDGPLSALSSHNSQNASVPSDSSVEVSVDESAFSKLEPDSNERPVERAMARPDLGYSSYVRMKAEESEQYSIAESVVNSSEDDLGLKAAADLYEAFHLLAGQRFDGLVAEYVFSAEQWRIASMRGALVDAVGQTPEANRVVMYVDLPTDMPGIAGNLLALRHRAKAWCLQESFYEADALLGITRQKLDRWDLLAAQRGVADGDSKLALPENSRVKTAESLIRMNEWMFTVMSSLPYLAAWHRYLAASFIKETRKDPGVGRDANNASLPTIEKGAWEWLTMNSGFSMEPISTRPCLC